MPMPSYAYRPFIWGISFFEGELLAGAGVVYVNV
jgi:hypothetical protein